MDFSGQFPDLWKYLATFLTALVTSFLLVPLAMRLAAPFGMIDEPDSRRIHLKPIPRSGGLAVFIAFHVAALACYFIFWPEFRGGTDFSWWLAFAPASFVLFFIGWMDDSEGLSPWIKLLGQFTAANLFFILSDSSVGNLLGLSLPLWLEWTLTIVWCLALINAFNLIDGMDGLCAGIAVISGIGIALSFVVRGLAGDAIIALALIGAAIGFLRYNFYPARIFLGDTGSMFLGFTLAAIALQTSDKSTLLVSFGIPLVAAGIPIFDTLLAIWRRSARRALSQMIPGASKSKIMGADKDHLHHRLLTLGLSQRRAALLLYAANLFLVTVGLVSILQSQVALGFLLIAFLLGVYVMVRHVANVELWDTGTLIARGFRRPKRGTLLSMAYPVWDLLWLGISFIGASILIQVILEEPIRLRQLLNESAYWITPVFVAVFISKAYSRVWSQAHFRDFLILAVGIYAGATFGLAFKIIFSGQVYSKDIALAIIFVMILQLGLFGIRTVNHMFREWLVTAVHEQKGGYEKSKKNVLLYGAGDRGNLYLQDYRLIHPEKISQIRVVGFIDDNIWLRHRLIHGSVVLGTIREIPKIVKENDVNEIIITCKPLSGKIDYLIELCNELDLKLSVWNRQERVVVTKSMPTDEESKLTPRLDVKEDTASISSD